MELQCHPRVDIVWRDTMLVPDIPQPQVHDPATLVQDLLDEAYRADLKVACAECFSGGAIAAKFGAAQQNRRQFAGAFILNCEQAIGEVLRRDQFAIRQADSDELAADMARSAMRATGAGLALGVVAPRGAMRFGPVSLAAMDDRGNRWSDRLPSSDLPERAIAGHAIAFLLRCLRKSLSRHL